MVNLVYAVGLISTSMLAFMLYDSYDAKKQLYPALALFSKSKAGVAVLHIEWLFLLYCFSKLGVLLLFGALRAFEMEKVKEKLYYAVTDTCIAFAIFSNEIASGFLLSLSYLLFVKYFHFIFEVRISSIERELSIPMRTVTRTLVFFLLFCYIDVGYALHMFSRSQVNNNLQFLLINEYLILCVSVIYNAAKFLVHYADFRRNYSLPEKGLVLSYLTIAKNFVETVLFLVFLTLTMIHHGIIPLLFIRPFFSTVMNFFQSVKAQINCNRVVSYINDLCPNATEEELSRAHDTICVVCREEMTTAKKLPCGHMFHVHCLKSWFQRQQTCPTCRLDILHIADPTPSAPRRQPQPPQAQAAEERGGAPSSEAEPRRAEFHPSNARAFHHYDGLAQICPCPTCRVFRTHLQIPRNPNAAPDHPPPNREQARAQLIMNIRVNLEAASAQLRLLEAAFVEKPQ